MIKQCVGCHKTKIVRRIWMSDRKSRRTAWSVMTDCDGGTVLTGMTTKMALSIISLSVTATNRLHQWRTRRLTAAPGTTFRSHVTLLTNRDADCSTAWIITYTTSTKHWLQTQQERKLRQGHNLIRHSNPDIRLNLYPDVCRIAPKMYWIHSLVGVSHFTR